MQASAEGFKSDCSGPLWIKEKSKYDKKTNSWLINSSRRIASKAKSSKFNRVTKCISFRAHLDKEGKVVKLSTIKSSNDKVEDNLAKNLILESSPFKNPPQKDSGNFVSIISFNPEPGCFVDVDIQE